MSPNSGALKKYVIGQNGRSGGNSVYDTVWHMSFQ